MSNTLLNYRTHVIAIVLALAVGLLPQLALGATYTVTKTADTADGSCTVGDCSLREAVIAANGDAEASVITIPAGTYTFSVELDGDDNDAATGDLDINTDVTITGAGSNLTIIDAADLDRVLHIRNSAYLTISGVTIQNGFLQGSSIQGAGIYVESGTLDMVNSSITNNTLDYTGIMGSSRGAGIACSAGVVRLTDSIVNANTYTVGDGEGAGTALYLGGNCSADVSNTDFANNTGKGGAIHVITSALTTKEFDEITVSGNTAVWQGAGMYIAGGAGENPVVITNSLFTNNATSGDGSASQGGAIWAQGPLQVTNTAFYQNSASHDGGAIYASNQDYVDVVLSHVTITNNTSGSNGGGIAVEGGDASITLNGSMIGENNATTSGEDCYDASEVGGVFSAGYNYFVSITGCNFTPAPEDDAAETGPQSYIFTASPSDNGGNVDTLDIWANGVTRVVPVANCLDAAGEPLTRDARGYPRPEVGFCNIGTYEPDEIDPELTLIGASNIVVTQGREYTELGANATDNFGLSEEVQITGVVDTNIPYEYSLTYTVSDYDNNQALATRTVTVVPAEILVEVTVDDCGEGDDDGEAEAVLTTQPTADVVLEFTSNDTTEGIPNPTTLTFTTDNWNEPQITNIDCLDDDIDDGNIGFAILHTSQSEDSDYDGITDGFSLINFDNDDPIEEPTEPGAITSVDQAEGTLTVTYEDNSTEDIIPFKGNANFRYVLSSNSNALIVTNGRRIKVYVQGSMVSSQKLSNPKLRRQFYRLKASKLYMNSHYDTIAFLSASKTQGKVVAFRLTSSYELTKMSTQEFAIADRTSMKLALKRPTKRVIATVGSGESKIQAKFKLTKKGTLTKLQ